MSSVNVRSNAPSRSRLTIALFAVSAIFFVVSLFCPAYEGITDPIMPGWAACYQTFRYTAFPWFETPDDTWCFVGSQILLPLVTGTFANLNCLASAIAGYPLRRHAPVFFVLATSGLLAGILMPLVMAIGGWGPGPPHGVYAVLHIGYWLWIAALTLHAAGWGSVVWNQQHWRQSVANFTLLTTACFGWKLHRRHAIPMLVLSINGLLAAMLMPAMMEVHRTGVSLEVYGELKVGYWLWIVTFALTAVGWWSVVRKQRSQRVAG